MWKHLRGDLPSLHPHPPPPLPVLHGCYCIEERASPHVYLKIPKAYIYTLIDRSQIPTCSSAPSRQRKFKSQDHTVLGSPPLERSRAGSRPMTECGGRSPSSATNYQPGHILARLDPGSPLSAPPPPPQTPGVISKVKPTASFAAHC